MHQQIATVQTPGRGLVDITASIGEIVAESGVQTGLAHVFILHTSASLTIQENADGDVLSDLNDWFGRTVTDGDPRYRHTDEGPDDMSGHIRTALTDTTLTVPVRDGKLLLGTWQAVYLFEHRTRPYTRRVAITVQG
ncbi:MAG: secondary thiamine-phosphate synthase enzyme YjbQ [Proteobacteria bacterium]|nr:secondary thiamine-phosphate synthase enzyme YjbQ [Pseudomonadota bacterium]